MYALLLAKAVLPVLGPCFSLSALGVCTGPVVSYVSCAHTHPCQASHPKFAHVQSIDMQINPGNAATYRKTTKIQQNKRNCRMCGRSAHRQLDGFGWHGLQIRASTVLDVECLLLVAFPSPSVMLMQVHKSCRKVLRRARIPSTLASQRKQSQKTRCVFKSNRKFCCMFHREIARKSLKNDANKLGTPDLCLPRCVYGLTLYLGNSRSWGKVSGGYPSPSSSQGICRAAGQTLCVSTRPPCLRRGALPDTSPIPRHTSG